MHQIIGRMGEVFGLDGLRIDPLEEVLRRSFLDHAQARAEIAELPCPSGHWRTTARRVARRLGRPVHTFENDGVVCSGLKDWSANDRETALQKAAMRRAVDAMSIPTVNDARPSQ